MKKILFLCLIILIVSPTFIFADRILYAEQYYKLFHLHFYQYPEDTMENIYYLELALKADFCNPLYAIARVKDERQYGYYQLLFKMHVNLKIVEQYLTLGSKYDKFELYFFNKSGPWRSVICDSLQKAKQAYKIALYYWDETLKWSHKAWPLRLIQLEEIQYWKDENFRIETLDLDYRQIINRHLERIQEALAYLECNPPDNE